MLALMAVPVYFGLSPTTITLLQRVDILPEDIIWARIAFPSMLVLLFCGIFAGGWIVLFFTSRNRDLARRSAVSGLVGMMHAPQNRSVQLRSARRLIKRANLRYSEGDDYLHLLSQVSLQFVGNWTFYLLLAGLALLTWDISRVSYVTMEGLTNKPYFALRTDNFTWADVTKITTGCNGKADDYPPNYQVYFADGYSINFTNSDYQPHQMRKFEAMELVDSILRERAEPVPWEKSTFPGPLYKGEVMWSEECFAANREGLASEQLARFDRLYRYR